MGVPNRALPPGIPQEGEWLGVRRWRIVKRRSGLSLQSLYSRMIWLPQRTQTAYCSLAYLDQVPSICQKLVGYHNCGIWACQDRAALKQQRYVSPGIEGYVRLFDSLYKHGNTIRALHGEIRAFFADSIRKDHYGIPHEQLMDFLRSFEVPILNTADRNFDSIEDEPHRIKFGGR